MIGVLCGTLSIRPTFFQTGKRHFSIYKVAAIDGQKIASFKKLTHDGGDWKLLALVTFDAATFKFGIANDEVWRGLPYYNQGIGAAQIIENSAWVEEIKRIHKVHPSYNERLWNKSTHYVSLFKEEMFEVIATGYKIEIFETTQDRLGQEIVDRMSFGE